MLKEHMEPNDSRIEHPVFFKYVLSGLFLILFLMPMGQTFAEEWNKGGNLHQASVRRWLNASEANRLATSADWFMSLTQKSNKALLDELKAMDKTDYDGAFKYYASRLESCISDKLEKKTVRYEDKVVDYAEKCYKILHGGDSM